MSLFSKRKDRSVQSFVLKLINNQCPGRTIVENDTRADSRIQLVTVVVVVPVQDGKLEVSKTFLATTKEFSNNGVSVVLDARRDLDEVVLGFRFEGEMTFMRAEAIHDHLMGGSYHQLGFRLHEVVSAADHPELASLSF